MTKGAVSECCPRRNSFPCLFWPAESCCSGSIAVVPGKTCPQKAPSDLLNGQLKPCILIPQIFVIISIVEPRQGNADRPAFLFVDAAGGIMEIKASSVYDLKATKAAWRAGV